MECLRPHIHIGTKTNVEENNLLVDLSQSRFLVEGGSVRSWWEQEVN